MVSGWWRRYAGVPAVVAVVDASRFARLLVTIFHTTIKCNSEERGGDSRPTPSPARVPS